MALENLPHAANTPGVAALSRALIGVGVLIAFWIAARADGGRRDVLRLAGRVPYVGLLIIGLVTALETVGTNVGAMVVSLGLVGFALGFALKDALSNLLAGVTIPLCPPVRVGDRIAAAGLEGIVASIDLRYTTSTGEDRRLLSPNAMLFTNSITVYEAPALHVDE